MPQRKSPVAVAIERVGVTLFCLDSPLDTSELSGGFQEAQGRGEQRRKRFASSALRNRTGVSSDVQLLSQKSIGAMDQEPYKSLIQL